MSQPELKVQIAIIKWLRTVMPKAMIQHCKNEHQKAGHAGMLAAMRNRSAGVMAGFPDLIILPDAETGPFFLEVKAPKGRTSDTQKEVHGMLQHRGYPVAVVKSVDDVRAFLADHEIPHNEVSV